MKIHEYQAKEFFTQYGIPTADGIVCRNAMACADAYKELHSPKVVIKAQVLTGGRGKAGGVKLASGEDQVVEVASSILGMDIKGYKVDRVMVAKAVNIESEYYISLVV
ncbi:MAG: acetate--CoA ligase family protein, partial [Bacteroidales bacterium]|nr:acetate--CoA ligase family protein [Bacteroidales bacterium]